jgi:hypothetical protein
VADQILSAHRHQAFRTLLQLFTPGKCVDLGTGHGSFATEAARLGWDVTAIDARTQRFPDDSRVTWERADIRQVDLTPYDLTICLGLFYHLTLEDQLDLLRRATGRPLILDTHLDHGTHTHPLSDRMTISGYEGRMYRESNRTTSSWGNPQSFWPTLDSFHRMLTAYGFVTLTWEPWLMGDRTFFLALPQPA